MIPFFFGIPLRARSTTDDWDLVCANLKRTLDCVLNQQDAEAGVVIVGHDRPDFLEGDTRVRFVDVSATAPAPTDVAGFNADKRLKKTWIGHALRDMTDGPFYFMHMDADDLVHREFVKSIQRHDNGKGYLIRRGYMVDVANRRIAPANEQTTPFYKHCGSCAVVHFTVDELPESPTDHRAAFSRFRHHAEYHEEAAQQGKALKPMSAYVGAYLVNHGENNRRYRGMDHKKTNFVERNGITDPAQIQQICADFEGLAAIMGDGA